MPHSTTGAHGYIRLTERGRDDDQGTNTRSIAAKARAFGSNNRLDVKQVSVMDDHISVFMYVESPDPAPQAKQQMQLMHDYLDRQPEVAPGRGAPHCCWIDA